jgi:hypothetical protein
MIAQLHRFKVTYRPDYPSRRLFHRVVWATDPDDARRQAQLLDEHYGSTTTSPRRYKETA